MGISEAKFCNRKWNYGGLGITELGRLKQMEDESQCLKRLVADLSLNIARTDKKALNTAKRLELVNFLKSAYCPSAGRAFNVVQTCSIILNSYVASKYTSTE